VAENELLVEVREATGKGAARRLRQAGRIPGVCYGRNAAPVPVSLDPKGLEHVLRTSSSGFNTLFELKGGGAFDGKPVLVRELQRNPVNGRLVHADLYMVDLQQKVHVEVPVHLEGSPEGVKMGGILEHTLREIEFECLPQSIPEEVRVDVSALEIGHSLHVRDLTLPEGATLLSDPELAVVLVAAPAVEEEPTPAEGEVPEGEEAAAAAEGEAGAAPSEDAKEGGEEKKEGGE
jgi:large subunit ribosomal protein L25